MHVRWIGDSKLALGLESPSAVNVSVNGSLSLLGSIDLWPKLTVAMNTTAWLHQDNIAHYYNPISKNAVTLCKI